MPAAPAPSAWRIRDRRDRDDIALHKVLIADDSFINGDYDIHWLENTICPRFNRRQVNLTAKSRAIQPPGAS